MFVLLHKDIIEFTSVCAKKLQITASQKKWLLMIVHSKINIIIKKEICRSDGQRMHAYIRHSLSYIQFYHFVFLRIKTTFNVM